MIQYDPGFAAATAWSSASLPAPSLGAPVRASCPRPAGPVAPGSPYTNPEPAFVWASTFAIALESSATVTATPNFALPAGTGIGARVGVAVAAVPPPPPPPPP